jgi:hypothetical protein
VRASVHQRVEPLAEGAKTVNLSRFYPGNSLTRQNGLLTHARRGKLRGPRPAAPHPFVRFHRFTVRLCAARKNRSPEISQSSGISQLTGFNVFMSGCWATGGGPPAWLCTNPPQAPQAVDGHRPKRAPVGPRGSAARNARTAAPARGAPRGGPGPFTEAERPRRDPLFERDALALQRRQNTDNARARLRSAPHGVAPTLEADHGSLVLQLNCVSHAIPDSAFRESANQ